MFEDLEANLFDRFWFSINNGLCCIEYHNSFERRLYHDFQKYGNLFENHSSHDAPPPDFVSVEHNIMFDMFQLDDSEQRKGVNLPKMRQREMTNEIRQSWLADYMSDDRLRDVICIDKYQGDSSKHSLIWYVKSAQRIASEHLHSKEHPSKIRDLWISQWPSVSRKGIFIYDDTEHWYNSKYVVKYGEDGRNTVCMSYHDALSDQWLYKPWKDAAIMAEFYEDPLCDFVVIYMPSKNFGFEGHVVSYPQVVFLDTRYPNNNWVIYNYAEFIRA